MTNNININYSERKRKKQQQKTKTKTKTILIWLYYYNILYSIYNNILELQGNYIEEMINNVNMVIILL